MGYTYVVQQLYFTSGYEQLLFILLFYGWNKQNIAKKISQKKRTNSKEKTITLD